MSCTPCTPLAPPSEARMMMLASQFPERTIAIGDATGATDATEAAVVAIRETGGSAERSLPLVCLHGIGSGAASWLDVAQSLAGRTRLIAWDAPGYGASTPLPVVAPQAVDYAQRLHDLLDALGVARCVLVGHSLGALVAAAATRLRPARIAALVLISPAQGYGAPGREAERSQVHAQRMASLTTLGIVGMATQRAARLVSDQASATAREWVRWNMARLNEHGYRQAVELLCGGDLLADLPPPVALPVTVACGSLDVITPPAACAEVAARCDVVLQALPDAGHACYVEQPEASAALLARVLAETA